MPEQYADIIAMIRNRYGATENDFIPLHAPTFAGKEKDYLNECIDTTFVSSVGKFVDRFEEDMARYTGAKRAVVCVNGTEALHMALMLAGVKADDEVITQPLSFVATCNAISYIGAHPVFIDVDRDTMGMSPDALEKWLKENTTVANDGTLRNRKTGRRIAAVVPMHTFGHPVRIDRIALICAEYNIPLIEDAAESVGSVYKGKHTGTFGMIGAVSFNGNKTITTGGGGILLFNDEELGNHAKYITTQAKRPHRWEFYHTEVGYNYRMPNINAALGCAQLEQIETFITSKRATAKHYADYFADQPNGIKFMVEPEGSRSNYWLNALLMPDREARDAFLEYSNDNKVMTRPVWELMHRLPMWQNAERGDLSNSEYLADRIVNIPSSVIL